MRLLSLTLTVTQWRNRLNPPRVKKGERRSVICLLYRVHNEMFNENFILLIFFGLYERKRNV